MKLEKLLLLIAVLVYGLLIGLNLSEAYVDFGDGNYMYISSRLADGITLYKDILSPQPPCHLYVGKFLIKLGRAIGNPLYTIRIFEILLHILTAFILFAIGKKLFKDEKTALLSAVFYLFIPIGFWWSTGYQSELIEIFFLSTSFYFFIQALTSNKKSHIILASLFATFAAHTNMTAVPYVAFNYLYLIVRKRKLFLWYFLPMLVVGGGIAIYFQFVTGLYFENVFLNQIGTYHREHPFLYGFMKIINKGKDVFTWEGGYVIWALLGMIIWLFKNNKNEENETTFVGEYTCWYALFSILSIIYVSKGGTEDYIFTIGEPYVALFAAFFVIYIFRSYVLPFFQQSNWRQKIFSDTTPLIALSFFVLQLIVCTYIGIFFIDSVLRQVRYENTNKGVQEIKYYIDEYSKEGDKILAPPYYAFITNRTIIKEYAETYLWYMKYINETESGKKELGVKETTEIANAINKKEIPIIIINLNMTYQIPEIEQAIKDNYKSIIKEPIQTLNEKLGIFVPNK